MIGARTRTALFGLGLTFTACNIGGELFYFPFGHGGGGEPESDAGKRDRPPVLTLTYIAPTQTDVGASITLNAEAEDPDGDPVELRWSGGGGTVANPRSGETTYTCTEPGEHALIITAQDPDGLTDVAAFIVTCV
ncbi:MAG TPA: PKD domain-containing protein [Polyangiaceae bacterium]|nr:PKD domain-containing protein [Polyangiaceae bacterium]